MEILIYSFSFLMSLVNLPILVFFTFKKLEIIHQTYVFDEPAGYKGSSNQRSKLCSSANIFSQQNMLMELDDFLKSGLTAIPSDIVKPVKESQYSLRQR
jgi:hypothetical protein